MAERRRTPPTLLVGGQTPPPGLGGLMARPARVIVTPIQAPLVHPLSKRDVQLVLSVLPPSSTAGLRSVSLLSDRVLYDGTPVFASYRRAGFIRLHAVSSLPWLVPPLAGEVAAELRLYGADLETRADGTRLRWPREALRVFYAVSVLLPAVARHHREHEGRQEGDATIRALNVGQGAWRVPETALRQWRDLLRQGDDERPAR